ncbi:MAG: glycosyltransferase family 4 protein [Pseudomonadota bacterium]
MSANPRVRVLFLNSCVNGGGAGRSLQTYLENMDSRIEAHVVMPEQGVIGEHLKNVERIWYVREFVERIQRSPYRFCERLGWRWLHFVSNWVAIPVAMKKITDLAREIQPDLIYCNHMLANPVGAWVGSRLGIPVVFHARNIHVAWFGRKFYRFLADLKCTKKIICNSLASSLIYREYTEEKVEVVHNFVDLQTFNRATFQPKLRKECGIAEDALVIGYAGRILAKKGIPVLLEAFQRIASLFPTAVLALVGDNDGGVHKDLRGKYEDMARTMGIGDRTFFIGFREDIRPYVSDFDILALPSVEPESFGRVLIEAMAFGIPSVVSALGGAVEVVRHGLNGLWSIPGDSSDLAIALTRLMSDPDLRTEMGRHGASDVYAEFSAVDQSRRITDILVRLKAQVLSYPAWDARPRKERKPAVASAHAAGSALWGRRRKALSSKRPG